MVLGFISVEVIFTKHDGLVRTRNAELREDNDVMSEAKPRPGKHLIFACSLSSSVYPDYEADVSSIVDVTHDLVRDKLIVRALMHG